MKQTERIVSELLKGPRTAESLSLSLGIPQESVRRAIQALRKEGCRVTIVDSGARGIDAEYRLL